MFLSVLLMLSLVATCVMSDCTDGMRFRAVCIQNQNYNLRAFLLHERPPPNDDISSVCGCNDPIRWTVSSDHTRTDLRTLNTSSPRYTNTSNTLQLNLDTVMGEDGGFYECECNSGFSGQLCIIVYEQAVFASCPSEFSLGGCSEETPLSVRAGESAEFNATVVYTPGGSCDFMQTIERISLTKINETFGGSNEILYNCLTAAGEQCDSGRVTLSRGNQPGLDFIFTLPETVYRSDSGLYEVAITRLTASSRSTFTKQFRLRVDPAPPTDPPTTMEPTLMSSTTSVDATTSEAITPVPSSSNLSGVIAAAVLVPVSLIVLITLGILLLAVRWQRVFHKHPPPEEKKKKGEQHPVPPNMEVETDMARAMNGHRINDTAEVEVIQERRLLPPLSNNRIQPDEGDVVIQLPPENTRKSVIESSIHDLPSAIDLPLTEDEKDVVYRKKSLQSDAIMV